MRYFFIVLIFISTAIIAYRLAVDETLEAELLLLWRREDGLLLAAEILIGVTLLDLSPVEVFTKHDPVSGSVYYAMLGVFASMPWLLWKFGKHNPV